MILEARELLIGHPDGTPAVRASFELEAGRALALTGPSGVGKTTLLRGLVGLRPRLAGTLRLEGSDVGADLSALRRCVRMVHQGGGLDPLQRVDATIRRSAQLAGHTADVAALLESVSLPGLAARTCGSLSGGQAMRVALARALAARPKVLLLDEVTRGLDPPTATQLLALIQTQLERGVGVMAVTHQQWVAERLTAAALELERDPGALHAQVRRVDVGDRTDGGTVLDPEGVPAAGAAGERGESRLVD